MILVDNALKQREHEGRPVRVGLVGAGYMGRGIAAQLLTPIAGLRLVAISNRNPEAAKRCWHGADSVFAATASDIADGIRKSRPVVTDDASALCAADGIDVVIEATGHVDFGARVALDAIEAGKHVVLFDAELDATIGPILKVKAESAGVVLTNTDGDEPGVAMNLARFVSTIGFRPLMAGNIKGFLNRHRNPDTQQGFADKVGQRASMVTSFADGTKLSMETAILANACGFGVGQPGMFGHECEDVNDIVDHFTPEYLLEADGLVDFALGAKPGSGAFVIGYSEDPVKRPYMRYFKMGDGPLYVFHTPFHLPHLEVAITIARAALFNDATVTPIGAPTVDVATYAKRDLKPGDVLDGIGGFDSYGVLHNFDDAHRRSLLPMGLAGGCRVLRPVRADEPIPIDAVSRPAGRLCDRLRAEQDAHFASSDAEFGLPRNGSDPVLTKGGSS